MDGFSYVNIFATKGIEYLIIISFLILIVLFWRVISKQKVRQEKKSNAILTESILNIPQGLLYAGNHTWAFLEKKGNVKVGIDDFLLHITGDLNITTLKKSGDYIRKGELMAMAGMNGKELKVNSPITGMIVSVNNILSENDRPVNDPYGKSWICSIKPEEWKTESASCYFAADAVEWTKNELGRFRDFLAVHLSEGSENALPVLQDGGELRDNPLAELTPQIWQDFEKSFLI